MGFKIQDLSLTRQDLEMSRASRLFLAEKREFDFRLNRLIIWGFNDEPP